MAGSDGGATRRLVLRRWTDADRDPFALLNADPEVMEHFPAPLTRAESDALVDRIEASFATNGFGLWALDVVGSGFAGFVGLSVATFEARFTPAVEIGWRLARWAWGQGYASEAGAVVLAYGLGAVGLHEVVSFTAATNTRSQAVMVRLGMTTDPGDDFDHPSLPVGHRLRRHVLYRARRAGSVGG